MFYLMCLLFLDSVVFMLRCPPCSALFPYTTLFRSRRGAMCWLACHGFVSAPNRSMSPELYGRVQSVRIRPVAQLTCCSDRKSTRLNSSHLVISYAVFCLKKKIILEARTSK